MDDLVEFHRQFIADMQGDADAKGLMTVEAFFERTGEILSEAGEIVTADRCYFETSAPKPSRVDGYGGDPRESDGVLSLIICDFHIGDEPQTILGDEIKKLLRRLVEFVALARKRDFRASLEETSAGFGLAELIATTWKDVIKVKLVLVTNRINKSKVDALPVGTIAEVPVTYNVWDINRLERFIRSGQSREDLLVDFQEKFGGSVPVLKASFPGATLESYIAVIPGKQLAAIYDKWEARLLEANVRSFLQARGKVNQGMRDTIRNNPEMFFSYNNGITATAESVAVDETPDGLRMVSARNLQIVNGGQTTASVHAARMLPQIDGVFVQMKLSIVPPALSEEVVPKISEFANSQNKVNAADFFANHPFHIRMEQFSRTVLAPAGDDQYRETKWFYERARGQFPEAKAKLSGSERKKFDAEYPSPQYFTKTDLAKFENSWRGVPETVSCGAQKNFSSFARTIGEEWTKDDKKFDEIWFKRLIAKAITFRTVETLVPKQDWYEGGYRANIVTYALAKVAHDAEERQQVVDLDMVWRAQAASQSLQDALMVAARAANDVITHPPDGIRNMSEWAKKQGCWGRLKGMTLDYDPSFERALTDPGQAQSVVRAARQSAQLSTGVEAQKEVFALGSKYWDTISSWGQSRRLLPPKEAGILQTCASIPLRIPSERQCIIALGIRSRLEEAGFSSPAVS